MNKISNENKTRHKIQLGAVLALFSLALLFRASILDERGGDYRVYKESVEEVLQGENLYEHTQRSFQTPGMKHWYAYLPLWLYLNTISYGISSLVPFLEFAVVMKIPVLLGDFALAVLLFLILRKVNFFVAFTATSAWLFNPHLLVTGNYTHFDPLPSFFVLLSLYFLNESEVRAAIFLAVAVGFKQYAILLAPYFLNAVTNKKRFLLIFMGVLLLLSLPFLLRNPYAYVYSTVFAHFSRGFGGKSILAAINEMFGSSIPSYVGLALIVGLNVWLFLSRKEMDKYAFATLTIAALLVFSPVLHRTYLLWLLPVYFVWAGFFSSRRTNTNVVFGLLAGGLYLIYWAYLSSY
jgi:hypothetical protein